MRKKYEFNALDVVPLANRFLYEEMAEVAVLRPICGRKPAKMTPKHLYGYIYKAFAKALLKGEAEANLDSRGQISVTGYIFVRNPQCVVIKGVHEHVLDRVEQGLDFSDRSALHQEFSIARGNDAVRAGDRDACVAGIQTLPFLEINIKEGGSDYMSCQAMAQDIAFYMAQGVVDFCPEEQRDGGGGSGRPKKGQVISDLSMA